jgi:class 3 adenylate cyclase
MRRSRLHRRVLAFRLAAYAWLIAMLLLFVEAGRLVVAAACGYAAVVPPLLAMLSARGRSAWPQRVETAATTFVVSALALPVAIAGSACAALLAGSVAQVGWRALPGGMLCAALGAAAGQAFAIGRPPGDLADLLAFVFVVAYMTPLAALGYEQTMRLHRGRDAIAARAEALERLSARLARYQPPALVRRLLESCLRSAGGDDDERSLRREYLTICFVDLENFTLHTQRMAPEELALVLGDFMAAITTLAARHGGSVDKFLGDGVLVCFGDAGRDPAHDARACLDMAAALPALMDALRARLVERGIPIAFGFRAGIASGYCSVGDFGARERLDHTVIGAAVNLGCRLQQLAPSGGIWVAAATRALLGDAASLTLVGRLDIKGFQEPQPVFRLAVPAETPAAPLAADTG